MSPEKHVLYEKIALPELFLIYNQPMYRPPKSYEAVVFCSSAGVYFY